jgi:hypothetical protein
MKYIYTDSCLDKYRAMIKDKFGIEVIPRNAAWNLNSFMTLANSIGLVVVNHINDISIVELTVANIFCIPSLVTSVSINSYPVLKDIADTCDTSLSLISPESAFIEWFGYFLETRGSFREEN